MPAGPRARLLLAYAACCLLWGSTWVVVKLGLEDLPPLLFAGTRMLLAGLVLLPLAGLHRAGLDRGGWGLLVGTGLLQIALPYALLFVGQQWVPSSGAALLFSTFPVWLLLVGRWLLPDQPLTPRKLLSALLGLAGVAVLQHGHLAALRLSGPVVLGGLLILAAAGVVAVANVLTKRHLAQVPPRVLVCAQTLASAVLLLALSALLEQGRAVAWTPRALGAIAYLAVAATVLTYLLLYWLLPRVPLAAVGAIPLLDTLVAVLLGVVLLGEALSPALVGGGVLILTAAALANLVPAPGEVRGAGPPRPPAPGQHAAPT